MSNQIINVKKYEMNKPSEFCQVIYFEDYKKSLFATLTPTQIDLMNCIVYKVRESIIKNNKEINYEYGSHMEEIDLLDLSSMLGKYNTSVYKQLISQLDDLRKIDVVINVLGKNKNIVETSYTTFIHEMKISRHKDMIKKKVKIYISTTMLQFFMDVKQRFTKFYLAIQFSMISKYSKLLYELVKDYEGIKTITVDFEMLTGLLNATGNNRVHVFSYFNNDILKKAVGEINEKSDIYVEYEPIKEKVEGQRKQVTKIKFFIEKQSEERLQQLGLIEQPISSLPFYNKSKSKLDQLVKNGYKVVDEDMWIQTDIKKNEERYDAEIGIDNWLKETDQDDKNEILRILAENLECEDPTVIIEDYKLVGLFSKDAFTRNPKETMDKLNWIIDKINEED